MSTKRRALANHHLDGDPFNNSIENFTAVDISENRSTSYSPGPWHAVMCSERSTIPIIAADGSQVCAPRNNLKGKHNAQLICSAPDLLKVAKDSLKALENLDTYLWENQTVLSTVSLIVLSNRTKVQIERTRTAIAETVRS